MLEDCLVLFDDQKSTFTMTGVRTERIDIFLKVRQFVPTQHRAGL